MGGAAGHMDHPFDLGWVKTGSNLIEFFERAKVYLEEKKPSSVKLDGVNVSFKVVDAPGGGKQFAVDRGTSAEVDISGITGDRVSEKFPEGHGMRIYIKDMLQFLDQAIPAAELVLKKLGVWDDPTKFLNAEYAKEGVTNIIKYDRKFLAIHGINQFYEKIAKAGKNKGNVRTGLNRPLYTEPKTGKVKPIKDASTEIPYDREALKELVEILKPYGEKYGFYIFGDIPSENVEEIDFSKALAEPFSIKLSEDNVITKSLAQWLAEATNPGYGVVKRADGRKVNPYHKELYKNILRQDVPLMDYIIERDPENPVDWDRAVDGAVMMHATRMLGNVVLKALESELGNLKKHEGAILRDSDVFGTMKPVKITGDFILGGTESAFQQDTSLTEEDEEIDIDQGKKIVAIVPGAFKPPHSGHSGMISKYATGELSPMVPKADKVIILISKPTKAGRYMVVDKKQIEIRQHHSEKMWNEIFLPILREEAPGVEFELVTDTPFASSFAAALEYIGPRGPLDPENDKVILGASKKIDPKTNIPDWKRWNNLNPKYIKPGLEIFNPEKSAVDCTARACGTDFSATDFRKALGDFLTDRNDLEAKLNILFNIFKDVVEIEDIEIEDENNIDALEEFSGVGAVAGFARNIEDENIRREQKENDDEMMIREVMKLIMERGILQ